MATAKKPTKKVATRSRTSATTKSAEAKKPAATTSAAGKKTAAKKTATKKAAAAKKTAAATTAAKKTAAKKTVASKTVASKAAAKKTAAKKTAAQPAAAKKPAAKPAAKKTAAAAKTAATATTATKGKRSAVTASAKKPGSAKKSGSSSKTGSSNSPLAGALLSNDVPTVTPIPAPKGTTKDGIAYTKDFDVKFLRAQRDELIARRERELARATRLEDEAVSIIEDGEMGDVQFDDEGGEGDTMVVQRDLDRLLSSQSRQSIAEIDAALERIAAGTYGYSEVSGEPIPRERLEALPETTVLAVEKVGGAIRR